MRVYLGLGSNLGDRRNHLSRAIDALEGHELAVTRVSPVVESPALLPDSAPSEWNLPYLNLVLECEARCSPEQLRLRIDEIQRAFGRHGESHWSPRPIDVDILLWGRECIETERLTIPHRDLLRRSFVLAPLVALQPRLTIPGQGRRTVLDCSIALGRHIPLWMGIVNVTPDSFSDGGRFLDWARVEPHVAAMTEAGVHILDVGGESTRPGAAPVDPATEWSRVGPVLERLIEWLAGRRLRPLLSLDTRHAEVAEKGLDLGVDVINDVGLADLSGHGRAGERQRKGLGRDAPRDGSGPTRAPRCPRTGTRTRASNAGCWRGWRHGMRRAWTSGASSSTPGSASGKNPPAILAAAAARGRVPPPRTARARGPLAQVLHEELLGGGRDRRRSGDPRRLPPPVRPGGRRHQGPRRSAPRFRLPRVVASGRLNPAPYPSRRGRRRAGGADHGHFAQPCTDEDGDGRRGPGGGSRRRRQASPRVLRCPPVLKVPRSR